MRKLPCSLVVSRSSGRDDDQEVHLQLTDEVSGCRVLEVNMSLAEWAKATFSSSGSGTMEIYDAAPLGKKREVKEELVPVPEFSSGDKGWADAALKTFEVDGWVGRKDDLFNHHKRVE